MKHCFPLMVLGLLAVFPVGCRSSRGFHFDYKTSQRYISLTSEPANASVFQRSFLDNSLVLLGKTPLKDVPITVLTSAKFRNASPGRANAIFRQVNNAVIRIEKEGYESYEGLLKTDPEETLAHHVDLVREAK